MKKKDLTYGPRDVHRVSWAFSLVPRRPPLLLLWLLPPPPPLLLLLMMMVVWMLAVVVWWKERGSWRNEGEECWQRDELKVN
jgi:hypothetical protein